LRNLGCAGDCEEVASVSSQEDEKGTVEVTLRFWRNYDPSGRKKGHRGSGAYLPDGRVWPAGTVNVPKQKYAPSTGSRKVNSPFGWMAAIEGALNDAGIKMVPPDYR
jgi:hypothetical protein